MSDLRECSFPGCGPAKRLTRGLCRAHYEQHRTGRPLAPVRWRWHSAPVLPGSAEAPARMHRASRDRDDNDRLKCRACGQWKPEGDFGKDSWSADGVKSRCRRCVRSPYLLRQYGITVEQYDEMAAAQGGVCAVCRTVDPSGRELAVDHDHGCCPDPAKSCGKCVRGLLCWPCNVGIGHLRDDPKILTAAAEYLAA